MSMFKATLVAVALATAAAAWTTPSIAAPNEQSMAEGSILMISPGGKYVMGKMTDKSMGMVRHAKPVAAGHHSLVVPLLTASGAPPATATEKTWRRSSSPAVFPVLAV